VCVCVRACVRAVVGGPEELGETIRGRHDQRCQDRGRLDGGELQGRLLAVSPTLRRSEHGCA